MSEFEVASGADFEAIIGPCSTSTSGRQEFRNGAYLNADLQDLFDQTTAIHFTIEDASGKKYYDEKLSLPEFENHNPCTKLASGTYWMKAINNQASAIHKLIVVDED